MLVDTIRQAAYVSIIGTGNTDMTTAQEITAAVTNPNFSHARQGTGCWRGVVYVYHRDPESPTGVKLALGGDSSVVDPIIREHRRTSALSPTER